MGTETLRELTPADEPGVVQSDRAAADRLGSAQSQSTASEHSLVEHAQEVNLAGSVAGGGESAVAVLALVAHVRAGETLKVLEMRRQLLAEEGLGLLCRGLALLGRLPVGQLAGAQQ